MVDSAVSEFPTLDIDPFSRAVLLDPLPYQRTLRDAGELVWMPRYQVWATGRYDLVHRILSDWKTFCSSAGVGLTNFHTEKPWRPPSLVLEADPPEHTHARAIIMRALSPAILRRLREPFEAEAARQVDRLIELGSFDAIKELAEGNPLKVFGDAVGIAPDDREIMVRYGNISFNALGPKNDLFIESMRDAESTTNWVMARCRREALDPNGLGAIMYAAADEGSISEHEALMLVRSFLSAGVDTTVRALGGALYCFANNPEQWRILREDPSRARTAVEETLRYESPFHTVFRTTVAPTEVGGVALPAEQKILLSLAAANRDPRKWPEPDRFDITRKTTGHVGFGAGIHGCVGQMIARLELEVVLTAMARRVDRIEVAGSPEPNLNNTVQGFGKLPIRFHA